jgi:nucleotide-binding universal stress UspA family protein
VAIAAEPGLCDRFPEIRFVHVQPRTRSGSPSQIRFGLREQVQRYFPTLPAHVPVGCDILKGCLVDRLASFAADFDSDLLLVGQALCPPALCGRLAQAAPCPVWVVPSDWPPVVRRILVPLGLCERHLASLRTALQLARRFPRAKVLAMHVLQDAATVADETLFQQVQRRKLEELQSFVARIAPDEPAVEAHVAVGMRVPDVVASVAHERSVDLIVLTMRGRSRFASIVQPGSTERILRLAPSSVLVSREDDARLSALGALLEQLCAADSVRFS